MNVVVALAEQGKLRVETEVLLLDGVEVNFLDHAVVGGNLLGVHVVHQGLGDGQLADAAHVKAVHIVPP